MFSLFAWSGAFARHHVLTLGEVCCLAQFCFPAYGFLATPLGGCICEHYRVSNLDEVAVWHSFARKGFVRLFGQFFAGLLTLRFHLGCVLFGTVLLSGKATCGFLPPCFEECIYKQHRVLIIFSFILFISAVLIRHYSRGVYANT